MNKKKQFYVEGTLKLLRKNKATTISDIMISLHCSLRTTRSRLKEWGSLSSYNQNGKYYTLPDIAQFNNYGIWRYQHIGFSQHGNLKQTFIYLIKNSQAGLSSNEIGEILSLCPRSFVSHFRDEPAIKREKSDGRYVYFSSEPNIFQRQYRNRIRQKSFKTTYLLESSIAISLLVEKIKHPKLKAAELSKRLKLQGIDISPENILDFFDYHGIEKKTPQ